MRISLLVTFWIVAVAAGVGFAIQYEQSPAQPGKHCSSWPHNALLSRDENRPTLVLFCHPRCPCTAASISELSRTASICGNQLNVHVLFIEPDSVDSTWGQTRIKTAAAAIEGVTVGCDPAGSLARTFGATTSGESFLFSKEGRLVFHGGLTVSRGHEGFSRGQAAIESWVTEGDCQTFETPVFGCALFASPVLESS